MKHLDEKSIEQYVLNVPEAAAQRVDTETHLHECAGCFELYQEVAKHYEEVDRLVRLNQHAVMIFDRALPLPAQNQDTSIVSSVRSLPNRAWAAMRSHPATSAVGALAFALLCVAVVSIPGNQSSPSYARPENEFLVAYDVQGDVVWKKHIGVGYSKERFSITDHTPSGIRNAVDCVDLNGDGKREVLAIVETGAHVPRNDLVCFDSEGNEMWRYAVHALMKFGTTEFSDNYRIMFFFVGDFEKSGNVQIYGYARHLSYYPSVVFKIAAETGVKISEYWHCGWFESGDHRDLDGDGIEEIILGGQNNSSNKAALLVLDPRSINGFSPVASEFQGPNHTPGTEKCYVLIPQSALASIARKPRNYVSSFVPGTVPMEVALVEIHSMGAVNSAHLFFDSSMTCVRIGENDDFVAIYNAELARGRQLTPWKEAYELIRSGILYWNGTEFTHLPTIRNPVTALP